MKNYQIAGFIGVILIVAFIFSPIAVINNHIATVIPVFHNFILGNGFWDWLDISAFSITLTIISFVIAYFIVKRKGMGIIITTSVALISALFILAAVWITDLNTIGEKSLDFHYGWGWILCLAGFIALYFSGIKIKQSNC